MKGITRVIEIKAIAIELRTMFMKELGNLIQKYTRITYEELGTIKEVVGILE